MNGEALYSVKWYKDGYEFYRYVPRDHPPAQVFNQSGINVDVSFGFPTKQLLIMFLLVFQCISNSCTTLPILRLYLTMLVSHRPDVIDARFPPRLLHFRQYLTTAI